jgi:hypothetical protein
MATQELLELEAAIRATALRFALALSPIAALAIATLLI